MEFKPSWKKDVTERHIKIIANTTSIPIGLPNIIEDGYEELSSGQFVSLNKTINTYDSQGHIIKQEYYDSQQQLAFMDPLGRGVKIESSNWNEEIITLDKAGNVLTRNFEDCLGKAQCVYSYDHQNQLLSEKGESLQTYQYDSLYNRLSKNELNYEVSVLNQVLNDSQSVYQYDRNGRVISKKSAEGGCSEFFYDALDRLTSIQSETQKMQYEYDAENRRLNKTYFILIIYSITGSLFQRSIFYTMG